MTSVQHLKWYNDVNAVRKMMENGANLCPSCCTPFDKGKHRKLIDTCGHEICYMCINSDHCPICVYNASQAHLPQNSGQASRPRLKTNGHFTTYMQARDRFSPERHLANNVQPREASFTRGFGDYSPRLPRNQKHIQWPIMRESDNPAAFSDDEVHSTTKNSRDYDLYMRLGLLFGDRMPLPGKKTKTSTYSSQNSYASISSLASSEANTTNTSPLSTLTDASDMDHLSYIGNMNGPSRKQSTDSVVSLMSTSTGHSSCSSPIGTQFQRHVPARTSDSFVQLARRNFSRRQLHHKSDDSELNLSAFGKKSNLAKLLNRSLKPLYFEVPQAESDPLFVGRQWLFKEIEQELSSELKEKKAIVLMGGPGTGKTAIISQILEHSSFRTKKEDAIYHDIHSLDGSDYNASNSSSSDSGLYQSISTLHHGSLRFLGNRLIAYHLCQAENSITCLVPEFVHSIAAQLCRAPQLTAYRDLVARNQWLQDLLSMPSCIADANSAFLNGIIEPLHTLRSRNRIPNTSCLIVVDGLNEAEYHRPDYGDTIATFLIRHIEAFPSWLKIIITIRTSYGEIIKSLQSHCILLDKAPTNENVHKDMCTYILHRINSSSAIRANITVNNNKIDGSSNSRFANHLSNLSKGSMLYTRLTLDLIEKGYLVVKSSSYRVLPVSLSEVYTLSFNLMFTTIKSYEKVIPILQICLASLYPLTLQELFYTLNAKYITDGIPWETFMERMDVLISRYFMITRQDGTIMFAHPSLREWLVRREPNENIKFLCDSRPGHAAIAFRMSRREKDLMVEECIEFGHHILKAHIYKTSPKENLSPLHSRDLQAYWVNLGSKYIESSLGCLRNIYSPNVKVSRLLLLAGASPNCVVQSLGNIPILAISALRGFYDMVSLLLEFGADVNATSNGGIGALALACQKGYIDIVKLLISKGAKVNQVDQEGKCPIIHAAYNGHLEIVVYLMQCDWPSEGDEGPYLFQAAQSSLVAAAFNGHTNLCEYLLDMPEIQVNESDMLTGHSALTAASSAGHLHTCNILIRRGASVSITNQRKETPLMCAAAEGHWEVVEKLILHGAPIEQMDGLGRTALMLAAMGGHPLIELLLSKGASTKISDKEGLTALSWACFKGHYQTVQCLLSHGTDINHADRSGRTPLDFAAYNGDPEIVQLLLDSGALMEHVDLNGMRPLDRAIGCKNTAAAIRFLHKGAKLGSQTWALAQGNPEILMLLLTKLFEDATVLCKRGRMKDAAHRYQYALKKFPTEYKLLIDSQFLQIKFQLYLGLSRCRRKMNEPKLALEAAEQAICLNPKSFEGYYAKARAEEALSDYESALKDIMDALQFAPQNQEMKRVLMRLKEQISAAAKSKNEKDKHNKSDEYIGFSCMEESKSESLGSTETIDQLCNLTLNLVADLNQLKDRMQDSGCESIH